MWWGTERIIGHHLLHHPPLSSKLPRTRLWRKSIECPIIQPLMRTRKQPRCPVQPASRAKQTSFVHYFHSFTLFLRGCLWRIKLSHLSKILTFIQLDSIETRAHVLPGKNCLCSVLERRTALLNSTSNPRVIIWAVRFGVCAWAC